MQEGQKVLVRFWDAPEPPYYEWREATVFRLVPPGSEALFGGLTVEAIVLLDNGDELWVLMEDLQVVPVPDNQIPL